MEIIGQVLGKAGWTLRSGHAPGADQAFERGCDENQSNKEIYLPWRKFEGSLSPLYNIPQEAFNIAESVHSAWGKCSQGVRRLHARNVQQILGQQLLSQSRFVVAWTRKGYLIGGTATALSIAMNRKIPIINLAVDPIEKLYQMLDRFKD